MSVQVCELPVDVSRETEPDEVLGVLGQVLHWCSGKRVRCENPVRDVKASQQPVVSRVAEDVSSWHSSSGELVYKDSLQLALDEVQKHHPDGHDLDIRQWLSGVLAEESGWVDVWSQWSGEKRNQEEWSSILDKVDCAPGYLWTKVFDVDGVGRSNALSAEQLSGAVLDNGLCGWVDDGKAMVVAGFSGAGEELLGLIDGGGGGDLEGRWEVADWLFARCD